ncbi:hypothetical protein TRIATDRAFT_299302 [Trichoderma atroviride IMI 206040]|uniref:Uncharacterized protein n=1 Tax=Hypocrea atroviridis (strain ATCC 20476 / IMI 206040) TaxID=452589 RepID=G9NU50_HYPAI|nr:uncharacterized protein TRIATDRAFT_299302 [Trichoderma atroviride IMI 206040]EHK45583.1 hypothetical protein TRIATDRAFT_299302 [Trichoderma atroviride IMI 206040]
MGNWKTEKEQKRKTSLKEKKNNSQSRGHAAKKPNPPDWSSLSLWYTSNSVTQIIKSLPSFSLPKSASKHKSSNVSFAKTVAQRSKTQKEKLRISWRLLRIYRDVESRTILEKEREKEH